MPSHTMLLFSRSISNLYRDFGRETEELVTKLEQPDPGSSPLAFDDQFPQPMWRQTFIILVKFLVSPLV